MDRRVQETLISVGENVHRARVRAGMTQSELADTIGIQLRSIQRVEAGYPASIAIIVNLANALGVPVAALFKPRKRSARRSGRPKVKQR